MQVRRNTRRTVKILAEGNPSYCSRYMSPNRDWRFVMAIDNNPPFERFLVDLGPEELERLVLQVPALQLIDALGKEGADEFAKTLSKVLRL